MKENHINSFKEAMANYPTGVTVMSTTDEDGKPSGLTVNSFASVSIDPLLILWSINKDVSTYPPFAAADQFAVNVLSGDQAQLANVFASEDEDKRFNHVDWVMSEAGLPVLDGTVATMQCRVHEKVEVGTHITFFGEVFDIQVNNDLPLLYHRRNIATFPSVFHSK